jgi:hypothetical protein
MKPERVRDWWIAAVLFAANLLILGPWLLTDFSNQPWNNGYMSEGVATMFRDHKWSWNPSNYGGAPFRYLYLPIFHVLTSAMPVHSIGRAFHLVTGVTYALTPVAVYILGRQLFEGRIPALCAAIAWSVFPSPAYIMPQWRALVAPWFHAPWGFVAMVVYEETVHNCALPLTLLAVAAAWGGRWVIATLLAAAVMLTSWPAMIGLGLILGALAVARTQDTGVDPGVVKPASRVIALTGTAYGLSAFWITPGYFVSSSLLNRVVLRHMSAAAPLNGTTWLILAGASMLIGLCFWRRIPARLALGLVWVALTGAVVLSTLAGNTLLPLPNRYLLEFNAGMVVAAVGLVLATPRKWQPWLAGALMAAGGAAAFPFISHAWKLQPRAEDPRTQVAYQIADWLNRNAGGSRIYAAGELDGNMAVWSPVPQVGGIGQGVSNPLIFAAQRQVQYGCGADSERIAELWLRALDIRYLVVHGAVSREYFHWFSQPEKFAVLPVAWDNGAGDTVYRVPEFDAHEAVVVDLNEMGRLPRLESTQDSRFLEAYVKWAAGNRPAAIHWNSVDSAMIKAGELGPNEGILVKINNDPGWRVRNAVTKSDPIGFLLIEAQQGQQAIQLRFGSSWDAWLGRAITAFTVLALLFGRKPRIWIAGVAVIPALAAYLVLMARVPSTVSVAEDAFVHLQPPLINPGGIVRNGGVIAAYGLNFGAPGDTVRVHIGDRLVGDRLAQVLYHGPNMVSFRMPADAPPSAAMSVEVNGCRGNGFTVATR